MIARVSTEPRRGAHVGALAGATPRRRTLAGALVGPLALVGPEPRRRAHVGAIVGAREAGNLHLGGAS